MRPNTTLGIVAPPPDPVPSPRGRQTNARVLGNWLLPRLGIGSSRWAAARAASPPSSLQAAVVGLGTKAVRQPRRTTGSQIHEIGAGLVAREQDSVAETQP